MPVAEKSLTLDDGFLAGYRDGTLARDRAISASAPLPSADDATKAWSEWWGARGRKPGRLAAIGYERGYSLGRFAADEHRFHGANGIPSPGQALEAYKQRAHLVPRHLLVVEQALPDRRLCGNGECDKWTRRKLTTKARDAAFHAARQALGALPQELAGILPYFDRGTDVQLTARVIRDPAWATRRLDDDNFWRGCKAYLDGWADAGVVWNDRQFHLGKITWISGQIFRGNLIVTMTPVPEGVTNALTVQSH